MRARVPGLLLGAWTIALMPRAASLGGEIRHPEILVAASDAATEEPGADDAPPLEEAPPGDVPPEEPPSEEVQPGETPVVDETAGMEPAARIARFRTQFDALLPGFYSPRFGATAAQYDARVARALAGFAELRKRYEQVQREFPRMFDAGIRHFRKEFPGLLTPTLDEKRAKIREQLIEDKVAADIESFLEDAKQRVTVTYLSEV